MNHIFWATQHTFGYTRVSATDQNLATQVEDLTHAGCTRIFQEKVSGTRTSSPALDELLAAVCEGDLVVVNRLARLSRNTVHVIQLVEEFKQRGVHFRALDLGIDSRTPAGKMIIGMFSSFNQYERENNREKSLAGIALAKRQGKHLGRPAGRGEAGQGGHGLGAGLVGGRNRDAHRHYLRHKPELSSRICRLSQLRF